MIRLTEVTENNWFEVAGLSVKDSQKSYVAPVIGILARGYVYRDCNARIFVIENDETIVGVSLVREFTDEPLGYDLQQFMIDQRYQGKGYGSEGLRLLCEAAVNHGIDVLHDDIAIDNPAIRMFLKAGFAEEYRTDEIIMLKKNLNCRNSNEDINWTALSPEQKNHQLFLKQKALLDQFLEKGAISQAQHEKSLHDLIEKMGETC